jgi:mannosyltransferase OCH1-like enzyme
MNLIPVTILFDDGVISQKEERIPRIIHQTYKTTENIPERWLRPQSDLQILNPEFKYMFWTDASLREILKENFPEFIQIYDSYPYNIQRVDAARYFLLYHFGGFYIDMDIGSRTSLSPLLRYPTILPKTEPIGFSNDFLAAEKGNRFMMQLIRNLPGWNKSFLLPILTVFLSTGPLFLTNQYHAAPADVFSDVYILPDTLYSKNGGILYHVEGNSWHSVDVTIINYIWSNFGVVLSCLALSIVIAIYRAKIMQILRRRHKQPLLPLTSMLF